MPQETKRIIDAIERQILISNNKFTYRHPGSHFALGAKFYGRFSSPMREIVGIFTHKELTEKLGMQKPLPDERI
jgi:ribonuclease R